MDMDSLNGRMDLFTGEIIMKVKEKEMESFIIIRMEALVRVFGKEEYLKGLDNMFNHKEKDINVCGMKVK